MQTQISCLILDILRSICLLPDNCTSWARMENRGMYGHRDMTKPCVYNVGAQITSLDNWLLWLNREERVQGQSQTFRGAVRLYLSQHFTSCIFWNEIKASGSTGLKIRMILVKFWKDRRISAGSRGLRGRNNWRVSRTELWNQLNCNSQDCSGQSAGKSDRLNKKY